MILDIWKEIPACYSGIEIDVFAVMPNHVHGVLLITGQTQGSAPANVLGLPDVMHRYKTMTTKRYADGVKRNGWPPFSGRLWQLNYWERVIRDEAELNSIREYIRSNAGQWEYDLLNISCSNLLKQEGKTRTL